MPTVLFVQDKPRSIAKVGPLLRKKGMEVRELSAVDLAKASTVIKDGAHSETVIIVDIGPESASAVRALTGVGGVPLHILLVTPPPGEGTEQIPEIAYVHPGKIVDGILGILAKNKTETPTTEAAPSQAAAAAPVEHIIALKTEKVRELRKLGIDPYPHRFVKKDPVASILDIGAPLANEQHSGKNLSTAGRVVQLRLMGKAGFFHLQDGSAKAQVYVRMDTVGAEAFARFKDDIQIGDFLGATGEVFKTKTGEPTLAAKSLTLLAKALRPLPEKWHGLKDTEARYRHRHLDLISNPEVRRIFEARSKIIDSIRRNFRDMGYLEVETPILLAQAGGASATPFKTFHRALDAELYLRIATELYLKRLIIGGFERVYEIGRIFRNEGIDTRHNPEFTMLEAYAAYADYHAMAELFETILSGAAKALGIESIQYRGQTVSLKPPFRRLYLPELWKEHCGADIHDILKGKGFNRDGLLALARKVGAEAGEATPSAKIFERIFDERILPHLMQPAFVMDHPTAITPLAKCKPGDESLVERFEFFMGTEELANAYTELNDPLDQRDRLSEQMRQRAGGDEEADILDEDFVQSMECGMPPTGGIGVGIDRLAMILTGHPSIREVILFPTLKPSEPNS